MKSIISSSSWLSLILTTLLTGASPAMAFEACHHLASGDGVVVDYRWNDSPTGIPARYRLSRSGDSYYAEVSVDLIDDEDALGSEQARVSYLQRANACLDEARPYLSGPNGEHLRVVLIDSDFYPSLPKNAIHIRKNQTRESTVSWSTSIRCPVVVHEVMHLLGLVDVYPERSLSISNGKYFSNSVGGAFDCRSIGPWDSVMHSNVSGLLVKPTEHVRYDLCFCSPGNASRCQNVLSSGSLEAYQECPAGFVKMHMSGQVTQGEVPSGIHGELSFALRGSIQVISTDAPTRSSMLYPAEFRAITEPGCYDDNRVFYSCVSNAYRTSFSHGGQGCLNVPQVCRSPDFEWLR